MLAWCAYIMVRAHGELNPNSTVQGLFRVYDTPYLVGDDWVVDPKKTTLGMELTARIGISENAFQKRPETPQEWCRVLNQNQIRCIESSGAKAIDNVIHLRFDTKRDEPTLWLGRLGIKHVVFEPGIGIVVRSRLEPAHVTLSLPNTKEKPW